MRQEEIASYIIQSEIKIRELKLVIESQLFFDFIPKTNPNEIKRAIDKERDYVIEDYGRIKDAGNEILKKETLPFALSDSISTIIGLCEKNIKIVSTNFKTINETLSRIDIPLLELKDPFKREEGDRLQG